MRWTSWCKENSCFSKNLLCSCILQIA